MCVSNNTQKNRSIMVDCRKTDRSPFVFYHEGSSGEGLLCRVRGLAYVSDIDLAFTMLLIGSQSMTRHNLSVNEFAARIAIVQWCSAGGKRMRHCLKIEQFLLTTGCLYLHARRAQRAC